MFGNAETVTVLLISGILLSFFNLGAWGALYAYTPEQYPMVIRGTGAGMAAAVGRIGGIFGPLLVGYLLKAQYEIGFILEFLRLHFNWGSSSIIFRKRNETNRIRITNGKTDSRFISTFESVFLLYLNVGKVILLSFYKN